MPREVYELTPPQLEWLIENHSLTGGEALDESAKMGWGGVVGVSGGNYSPPHSMGAATAASMGGYIQRSPQPQDGHHGYYHHHHHHPHHPLPHHRHPSMPPQQPTLQPTQQQQQHHHHHHNAMTDSGGSMGGGYHPMEFDPRGPPPLLVEHYPKGSGSSSMESGSGSGGHHSMDHDDMMYHPHPHNQHHHHQGAEGPPLPVNIHHPHPHYHHHHPHHYHSNDMQPPSSPMSEKQENKKTNSEDPYPHRLGKLTWEQSFENLKIYVEKSGHCNVPRYFDEHPQLGSWVHRQRLKRKSPKKYGYLSPEQIQQLTDLGFCWQLRGEGKQQYINQAKAHLS